MPLPPSSISPDLVYFDPVLITRVAINAGLSLTQLAAEAQVALNTVRDALRGKGLARHTAAAIARRLGRDVTDLLAPWDAWYRPPAEPAAPWSGAPEWEVTDYLNQGRLAPNGLYFVVCAMRHRHIPARRGRGKFYHLSWLPPATRDQLSAQLSRHAEVCARVGPHPHIALTLSSTPVAQQEGWWVIDDWVGPETLADRLDAAPWPRDKLPRLLHELALGLAALHDAKIVVRELAPARILIGEHDGRAVLTDFELAKLLDGVPSGGRDWPEDDPYRAPEIDGGGTSVQSDLYSWARVAVTALAREWPTPDRLPVVLGQAGVPKKVQRLWLDSLEPLPSQRPPNMEALLPHLAAWRKGVGG